MNDEVISVAFIVVLVYSDNVDVVTSTCKPTDNVLLIGTLKLFVDLKLKLFL